MATTPTVGSNGNGASTLSGLVSGIDTSTIISELMSVAAQPQQQLESQRSTSGWRTHTNAVSQSACSSTSAAAETHRTHWTHSAH